MLKTFAFSDRTEFSVTTGICRACPSDQHSLSRSLALLGDPDANTGIYSLVRGGIFVYAEDSAALSLVSHESMPSGCQSMPSPNRVR
jgi:hypothetical protein